jgi:hypothetical protein
MSRRIGSRSGNDRDAAACDINRGANENVVFGRPQRRRFTCRPANHKGGGAFADLTFAEVGECGDVDISVVSERRRHCRRIT